MRQVPVAYVVHDKVIPGSPQSEQEIMAIVNTVIHGYLMPYRLFTLTSMPLNAQGEIDLQVLPDVRSGAGDLHCAATPLEMETASIWLDVLGMKNTISCDKMPLKCNFFELGGSSLKALHTALNDIVNVISTQSMSVTLPISFRLDASPL